MSVRKASTQWAFLALLVLLVLTILLRFFHLDARTIHIDEGMGLRYAQMLIDGEWRYNPFNSHGPIYFFFGSFLYGTFGDNLVAARAATSAVSVLSLLLLLGGYRKLLSAPGRILLITGLGLSSGMAFYARYFIHEHIFIFVTVACLLAAESWVQRRDKFAPVMFILLSFILYATKETALITWAAWGSAGVLMLANPKRQSLIADLPWKAVGIAIIAGLLLHAVLFTVFFTNPDAFVQSFLGPLGWHQRAQTFHHQPFLYFIQLLWRNEFPLFFGAIVLARLLSVRKKWTPRLKFFGLWTVFITLGYSLIQYKTPWCIPNIILPLGLFVAFAFDALMKDERKSKQNRKLTIFLSILLIAGFANAWYENIKIPDRVEKYDYAYLQGDYSLRKFTQTMEDVSNIYEGQKPMPMQRIGQIDELLYILSKPYRAYDTSEGIQLGLPLYINYQHDDKETLSILKQSGKNYIRSTYTYMRDPGIIVDLFVEEDLWNKYITGKGEKIFPGKNPVYDYR